MTDAGEMDWKRFVASLIASLRWPLAFVAVAIIFRAPLQSLIGALAATISGT